MNNSSLLLLLWMTYSACGIEPFQIADNGKTNHAICLHPNTSESTITLANELAYYLQRITGTKFEVIKGNGQKGIVIGTMEEFPNQEIAQALKIQNYDGREAFAIKSAKDKLILIGATELGLSHAVFTLLEKCGCRWFFPAKEWEVIPHQSSLSVALDVKDKPKILARRIWYGYGPFPDDKKHPFGGSCQKDYQDWSRHNRMASSFRVYAGHSYEAILASNKKLFEEHPEYLALVKGKRQGPQFCLSNPKVQELGVQWVRDYFKKNPTAEMASLDCADGSGQCECAECLNLGSVSNRVFGLANHAAKIISKEQPGKMIGLLAYNEHSEPPDFTLEPNVYVQLTMGFIRGKYSFDELRDLWPKKCNSMGFYDYYSVWLWDFDKLPGGRGANLDHIAQSIRKSASLGATSIDAESGNNWGVHGLGYYVSNKLMWNPDADVKTITKDFYEQAFGPAAGLMQKFYERWMPGLSVTPIISRQLIGNLFRDIDQASRLTKNDHEIQARLDHLKHYLRYIHLRWLYDHEKEKTKQKEMALEILTFAFRTRYEYMNHWNAIQTSFANDIAKKFEEPSWARNNLPKPWINSLPVSDLETSKWFKEGLEFFEPMEVQEFDFASKNLKQAVHGGTHGANLSHGFQGMEKYAVLCKKGEPIELEITPGVIAWYRDRPDAKWSVEDSQGKKILTGSMKLDGEPHRLRLNVPEPGVYFFELYDSSAGWRIKTAPEEAITWVPQKGKRVLHLGQMQEMYFYVPKGTKELHYFWSGGPHKVLGPDRKLIQETNANDEVVRVMVPEGMAGKVWSLSARPHNQLWFFNAPNYLAASPSALLIPSDCD